MKRFSMRTLLIGIGVLCTVLAFAIQERERRRWETKFYYAVWHLENSQDYINGRLDDNDKWRSRLISKYGHEATSEEIKDVAGELSKEVQHLRFCLSDAWLLTGWDSNDEAQSENGVPQ